MPKYNPNPLFPNEPLFEIHDFSELPKSPRYTLYCNGQEQTVYHTDSFDYAIVVRRDDAPVSVEVCVSDSFKKAVLRPQSLEIPFDREENHIRFSTIIEPGELSIEPDLIKTVCLNLLDNARKAVGGNARIALKGHPVERGYQFIIEDNGCGMETNELSKIKEA